MRDKDSRTKNKQCNFCDGPENIGVGIWKVIIFRKYRGSFGKVLKWYCSDCLALDLEGYHTGGGPSGNCFKKIKRRRFYKKEAAFTRG